MEGDVSFNLEDRVNDWVNSVKVDPSITESDAEELRTHFLDQFDDLKKAGLNDKEAFWVASNRMNISEDVAFDYQEANNHFVQVQKSLLILGGVIVYFLVYNFIGFTSKGFFLGILKIKNVDNFIALSWLARYLIVCFFIVLIILVTIYFMEGVTIKFIKKIRLKPKHTIYLLLMTGFFELINFIIHAHLKFVLKDKLYIQDRFIHYNYYFDVAFPAVLSLGFIFTYYKYYKKTKI